MAVIRDKIVVEDGFSSSLDRYTQKCNQASRAVENLYDKGAMAFVNTYAENFDKPLAEREALAQAAERAANATHAEAVAEEEAARICRENMAALEQKAAAAEQAAEAERRHHEQVARVSSALGRMAKSILPGVWSGLQKTASAFRTVTMAIAGTKTPLDNLMTRMRRTVLMMFSARRVITYIKNALQRAPEEMKAGLSTLGTLVKDGFDRMVLSIVRGFLPAVDRLKQALAGVPNVSKAIGRGFELIGQAIGLVIDKVAQLVTWMGNNMETVLTAVAILLGLVAVKFTAVAIAATMANWPIILIATLAGTMAYAFVQAGGTVEEAATKIGSIMGRLYAYIHNVVAWIWNNALAPFAEAFGTMLDEPAAGLMQLLANLVSFGLAVLSKLAAGLDALFGSNLEAAVNGWKDGLDSWVGSEYGTANTVGRMNYVNAKDTGKAWGEKAAGIADKFSSMNLERYQLTELQDINANTGATAKAVDMAAEDLKSFVDMAERDYVMRVNLQTPTINITGQNTGNTKEDAEYLAGRIAQVLADQRAASPSVPVDYLYSGQVG